MVWQRRAANVCLVCLTFLFSCGCISSPDPPSLTTDQLTLVLSELLVYPDVTCEALRDAFDVEYLPLAETPDEAGLPYEEHRLPTADGQHLRVWYLPTRLDRGTVILSQGAMGTMPCYLFHARLLVRNGWSVVMYDFRGVGGSGGRVDLGSMPDDLNAVLDWTLRQTGREAVTLMGISLGTIPSVAVAAQRPQAVNGVVLDSPVALGAEIQRLAFALRGRAEEYVNSLAPNLRVEELVRNVRQPLLIFAAERDVITPPATIRLIYDRAAGPKRLVAFPGLAHAREPFGDTGTYTYELETFLSSIWSQLEWPVIEPDATEDD